MKSMTEKAVALGISQSFFSMIYNGRRKPSWAMAERWKKETKRTFDWWQRASLSDIQKVMDKV